MKSARQYLSRFLLFAMLLLIPATGAAPSTHTNFCEVMRLGEAEGNEAPNVTWSAVAWSPDGSRLAALSAGSIFIWDILTGEVVTHIANANVYAFTWDPTGEFIAGVPVRNYTITLNVWNADTGALSEAVSGIPNEGEVLAHTRSIDWSRVSNEIATTGIYTIIWNLGSDLPPVQLKSLHNGFDVEWHPDGELFALGLISDADTGSANAQTTLQIWDAETSQKVMDVGISRIVSWNSDGTKIAGSPTLGEIVVWDLTTGKASPIFDKHKGNITALVWNPDRDMLASASMDSTVKIWNAENNIALVAANTYNDGVRSIAWNPDGEFLAVATSEQVCIWGIDWMAES